MENKNSKNKIQEDFSLVDDIMFKNNFRFIELLDYRKGLSIVVNPKSENTKIISVYEDSSKKPIYKEEVPFFYHFNKKDGFKTRIVEDNVLRIEPPSYILFEYQFPKCFNRELLEERIKKTITNNKGELFWGYTEKHPRYVENFAYLFPIKFEGKLKIVSTILNAPEEHSSQKSEREGILETCPYFSSYVSALKDLYFGGSIENMILVNALS